MSSLHEITGIYSSLWIEIDNEEFDLDSLEGALDSIEADLKDKSINVAKYFQNLNADAEKIGDAIKSMQHRKKVMENKAARLKEYLRLNMENADIRKIESPWFNLSRQKNNPSVVIEDESKIDERFTKKETVVKIVKADIKAAIDAGEKVEGAKLVQGESLRIK